MRRVSVVSVGEIHRRVLFLRRQKVLLDSDLAELYGVETKVLLQAVKRNLKRFPADFAFRLSAAEWKILKNQSGTAQSSVPIPLRSQIVTSKPLRGGRRYLPLVFTEQGVAMLSSVLGSDRAIEVNIAIMRAFVRLREMLGTNRRLATKLAELERTVEGHGAAIGNLFAAMRQLLADPEPGHSRKIGFHRGNR